MRPYRNILASFFAILAVTLTFTMSNAHAATSAAQDATSWWTHIFPRDNPEQIKSWTEAAKKTNRAVLDPADTTFYGKADRLRSFVSQNSVNIIDKEFDSYSTNVPEMLSRLVRHAESPAKGKPHMECSARTASLYYLLKEAGIRSRIIIVYPEIATLNSHTYLEVLNPATGNWEIQDPFLGVYWVFKGTQKRASTADLLKHDVRSSFTPCRAASDCGFTKAIEDIVPYYAMASVLDMEGGDSPLLINPDRHSMREAVQFNGRRKTYCLARLAICPQRIEKIWEE
ncbi:MAG: hypothetical protein JWO78_1994 [Micavibrio sp.]|nr:hypothetical protein [Micavibrio sp.]